MIRVGVVGTGGMGGVHLKAYQKMENVRVAALCDIDPGQMEAHLETFGVVGYPKLEDMLAAEQLDMLDICTPSDTHKPLAIQGMRAGLHVLVEKPMTLSEADAAEMFDCAEQNGVRLMPAQVLRFWPEYGFLKNAVGTGGYGALLDLRLTRIGRAPMWSSRGWMVDPARSGGMPYDLHIHDLDIAVDMLGLPTAAEYRRVFNSAAKPAHFHEHLYASYDFSGVPVQAEAAWFDAEYPFSAGYLAHFEKAVIEYSKAGLTVYHTGGDVEKIEQAAGAETGINLPGTNGYANEITYFVECLEQGKPIERISRDEVCGVLRVLDTYIE